MFMMFGRRLGSTSTSNGTKTFLGKSNVHRYNPKNDTDWDEGSSSVKESRIVRWRRESVNGNTNLVIAGSMLGVVMVVVLVVFYLSHRSIRKRNEECPQRRWRESDASLEVYTVDQFFDAPTSSQTRDDRLSVAGNIQPILPPPSYELAVATHNATPDLSHRNSNTKLFSQLQRFGAKSKCQCQQKHEQQHRLLTAGHPQYDLVMKCRQCRRIIRDYADSDSDQSDAEFCECLLQNTIDTAEPYEDGERTDLPAGAVLIAGAIDQALLERCDSAEVLDDSGLPSYRTAAKLGWMACDQ